MELCAHPQAYCCFPDLARHRSDVVSEELGVEEQALIQGLRWCHTSAAAVVVAAAGTG